MFYRKILENNIIAYKQSRMKVPSPNEHGSIGKVVAICSATNELPAN